MHMKKTLVRLSLAGLFAAGSIAMTAGSAAAEPGQNTVVAVFWNPTSVGAGTDCNLARIVYSGEDSSGYYWCDNLQWTGSQWSMNLWVTH